MSVGTVEASVQTDTLVQTGTNVVKVIAVAVAILICAPNMEVIGPIFGQVTVALQWFKS